MTSTARHILPRLHTLTAIILLSLPTAAMASEPESDLQVKIRAGYSIGGSAPLGIPATIRSVDAFRLTPNIVVGADVTKKLSDHWSISAGARIENKAMDTEAQVKGYHMEVKMDDSALEGLYTGHVRQKAHAWMATVPLQAAFRPGNGRVTLKAGPYLSLLFNKDFSGYAFDGYLRKDTPTGPKVVMGSVEGEWATYDFTDDMRNLQVGLAVGADWQVASLVGVSADLSWGLTGIMKSSFKTIEQTFYPIYGTIGIYVLLGK